MMKTRWTIIAGLLLVASVALAGNRENELTGIYRKSHAKEAPRIEIDGHGRIPWLEVSGKCLRDVPDGTRIWVKGTIKSYVQGVNNSDSEQQQPTQWAIVMEVEECRPIEKPFEEPKQMEPQNIERVGTSP